MNDRQFKQLKIIYSEHNRVWSLCPYHRDIDRPNLCISLLDKYYGECKCWACGKKEHLNKQQMSELNLSGVIIYKNNEDKLRTRWKEFTDSCYDNLQKFPLLKLGLAKQLNVSTKSLDDWSVGYDNFSFTIPMFREDLVEYYTQRGTCGIQRRYSDGTKRCIMGSRLGLMYPRHIDNYYIFICEGFSDGISVWDLGLQSIARPHCRHIEGIEGFFGDSFGGIERIVIIPDNDAVGRKGAEQLKDELEGLCYCNEDWEEDCDITIFSFDGAKDVRQLIQLRGKDYVKQELEKYI